MGLFDGVFNWLGGLLSTIGGFFKHAYEWIVRHVITQIVGVLRTAWGIINGILYPVVKFLKRIRSWYFRHIFPIQHAILEVISRVRVALALLRLLGVKWAAKLDAELQKIQGWVTQSIQDVVGTLNTVQSYLDLIVDPGMIIRGDFFAATLFSSLKSLKNAVGFGSNAPLSAAEQQRLDNDKSLMNPATPFARTDASGRLQTTPAFDAVQGSFANAVRDVLR